MNKKIKAFVFLGVTILVLFVAHTAYNYLKERVQPIQQLDSVKSETNTEESSDTAKTTSPARDFAVQDTAGNEVKLSEQFGKPIVVNFWASWCPPCKDEMPDFEKVYQEMGEQVTFMMVDLVDGSRETIETGSAFIESAGYTFPVYFDVNQNAAYTYALTSIPTTLFINADGEVVANAVGAIDEETLRRGVALILE
jgi:Thiol-disulfide isomerase and thioredoxins